MHIVFANVLVLVFVFTCVSFLVHRCVSCASFDFEIRMCFKIIHCWFDAASVCVLAVSTSRLGGNQVDGLPPVASWAQTFCTAEVGKLRRA